MFCLLQPVRGVDNLSDALRPRNFVIWRHSNISEGEASAVDSLDSSGFWVIKQSRLDTSLMKMGSISCPETSAFNQLTLRNKPEDGRI